MKQILPKIYKLETEQERKNFFLNLWQTQMFKKASTNPESLVGGLLGRYSMNVRYYYEMQDKELERSAFTSWYNVLSLKDYDNRYIHDLYLLHELTHICSMPYQVNLGFGEWQSKMRENEVWASFVSEVLIYFEIPELRQHSFGNKIWVDKFLSVEQYKNKSAQELYSLMLPLRQKAYIEPADLVEKELADFKKFSFLFYSVWEKDYNTIEEQVVNLKAGKEKEFEDFLEKNLGSGGILFEDKIKGHYQNYIKLNNIKPHY